jgi:hypothetical protein
MSKVLIDSIIKRVEDGKFNKAALASKMGKSPSYFTDLANRKTITVDELMSLSEHLNQNFFDLIQVPGIEKKEVVTAKKKIKVSVVIEVDEDSKERQVLESIFDQRTVKKLIG